MYIEKISTKYGLWINFLKSVCEMIHVNNGGN